MDAYISAGCCHIYCLLDIIYDCGQALELIARRIKEEEEDNTKFSVKRIERYEIAQQHIHNTYQLAYNLLCTFTDTPHS